MKKFLFALFNENSEISAMRVMAVMSLLIGAILASKGADSTIVAIFVGAAFGGKVAQKFAEIKEDKPKDAFPDNERST